MQIGPLICLIDTMLVFSLRIHGFQVRDPCKFVLDPPFAPLINDFREEFDEKPHEFDKVAQMWK